MKNYFLTVRTNRTSLCSHLLSLPSFRADAAAADDEKYGDEEQECDAHTQEDGQLLVGDRGRRVEGGGVVEGQGHLRGKQVLIH